MINKVLSNHKDVDSVEKVMKGASMFCMRLHHEKQQQGLVVSPSILLEIQINGEFCCSFWKKVQRQQKAIIFAGFTCLFVICCITVILQNYAIKKRGRVTAKVSINCFVSGFPFESSFGNVTEFADPCQTGKNHAFTLRNYVLMGPVWSKIELYEHFAPFLSLHIADGVNVNQYSFKWTKFDVHVKPWWYWSSFEIRATFKCPPLNSTGLWAMSGMTRSGAFRPDLLTFHGSEYLKSAEEMKQYVTKCLPPISFSKTFELFQEKYKSDNDLFCETI